MLKEMWNKVWNRKAIKLAKEEKLREKADAWHKKQTEKAKKYEAEMKQKETEFRQYFDIGDKFNFLGVEFIVMDFNIKGLDEKTLWVNTFYRKQTGELEKFRFAAKRLPILLKENPDIKPKTTNQV